MMGCESPNEGVCLRFALNRNRQMIGQLKISYETESSIEGGCFRYMMMIGNRRMRGRV